MGYGCDAAVHVKLFNDRARVSAHGVEAAIELFCDLRSRLAGGDQLDDKTLLDQHPRIAPAACVKSSKGGASVDGDPA
jgi:hypothetical protein